jgi:predicted DNA-binding transcriptional regulator AlpA
MAAAFRGSLLPRTPSTPNKVRSCPTWVQPAGSGRTQIPAVNAFMLKADSGETAMADENEELLTTAEVALLARAPVSTVRYWRHLGVGPASFRLGRRVLYRRSDVRQWLDEVRLSQVDHRKITATSVRGAAGGEH